MNHMLDCKTRLRHVLDVHRPGQSARCLRNVSDQAGQPPAAPKLQPYLLEIIIGQGAAPQQPGDASAATTVTFKALGGAQAADNPGRPDHQPLGSETRRTMNGMTISCDRRRDKR